MAIDGTYEIEVNTPVGKMKGKLILKTDGDSLSGAIETSMGNSDFSGGSVNGDEFSSIIDMKSPMGKIQLETKGKVTGDAIAGEVKMGNFGTSEFSGKRL